MINRLLVFLVLVFAAFVVLGSVQAKEDASKFGITYPISELGNCTDLSACREFCQDPVNRDSCVDFARKKGFYKENKKEFGKAVFWSKVRSVLACDTVASCKELCSKDENLDKCTQFAKQANLAGGITEDPKKHEILERARKELSCNSVDECKSLCQKSDNRERCAAFASKSGLQGGVKIKGPGGCSSVDGCVKYCSDPANFDECSKPAFSQGFRGPGGCDSKDSCVNYCMEKPQECGTWLQKAQSQLKGSAPAYMELRTKCERLYNNLGSSVKSADESFYNRYCSGNISPEVFKKFCEENPQKCTRPAQNTDPTRDSYQTTEDECKSHIGCTWEAGNCTCKAPAPVPYSVRPYPAATPK